MNTKTLHSKLSAVILFGILSALGFQASATCQADFTWSQLYDNVISFTNISTGTTVNTTYYWSFGDGQVSTQENPVHVYDIPGTYYVCFHILDSLCSSYFCDSITVTGNVNCTMTVYCYESNHASCDTCADGVTHSFPSGGTAPYTYSWNTVPVQTTQFATGLLPGTYTVCVTDANGCTACCTTTVDTPSCNVLVYCYETVHASCDTCADGTAHAYPTGGTYPYTYVWNTNPVQTSSYATGLLPGSYTVCVTDANGCSACCTTTVDVVSCNMSASCYEYAHASCATCADGIGYAYPYGGTYPYTYEWNTYPVQTNSYATGLLPGSYTVCITDANGCSACCTVTIDTAGCNVYVYCYEVAHASCDTCADGSAHAYPTGGTYPYTYVWDTNPVQTTSYATGLLPGTYTVCVTDANGCSSCCTTTVDVAGCSMYAGCYEYVHASCATCADGIAHSYPYGGSYPYTYEWNTYPVQTTASATGLLPGSYTVCITDANGCSACCTVTIDTASCNLLLYCYQTGEASCDTCADGAAHVYPTGGTYPYSYVWNTFPVQTSSYATGLLPGTYTVLVTDANGCSAYCTVTVNNANPNCFAYYYLYPDSFMAHTYWAVNMSSGTAPISYLWSWGDGSFDSIAYPSHTYASAGYYTICLYIHDSTGCTDSICHPYNLLKLSAENTIITVNVVSNIPTSTETTDVLQQWSVFPNPSQGKTFINYLLAAPTRVSIDLYDLLGNKLVQILNEDQPEGEHTFTLDTKKLASSIYVLKIHAGEQILSQKIVVMD